MRPAALVASMIFFFGGEVWANGLDWNVFAQRLCQSTPAWGSLRAEALEQPSFREKYLTLSSSSETVGQRLEKIFLDEAEKERWFGYFDGDEDRFFEALKNVSQAQSKQIRRSFFLEKDLGPFKNEFIQVTRSEGLYFQELYPIHQRLLDAYAFDEPTFRKVLSEIKSEYPLLESKISQFIQEHKKEALGSQADQILKDLRQMTGREPLVDSQLIGMVQNRNPDETVMMNLLRKEFPSSTTTSLRKSDSGRLITTDAPQSLVLKEDSQKLALQQARDFRVQNEVKEYLSDIENANQRVTPSGRLVAVIEKKELSIARKEIKISTPKGTTKVIIKSADQIHYRKGSQNLGQTLNRSRVEPDTDFMGYIPVAKPGEIKPGHFNGEIFKDDQALHRFLYDSLPEKILFDERGVAEVTLSFETRQPLGYVDVLPRSHVEKKTKIYQAPSVSGGVGGSIKDPLNPKLKIDGAWVPRIDSETGLVVDSRYQFHANVPQADLPYEEFKSLSETSEVTVYLKQVGREGRAYIVDAKPGSNIAEIPWKSESMDVDFFEDHPLAVQFWKEHVLIRPVRGDFISDPRYRKFISAGIRELREKYQPLPGLAKKLQEERVQRASRLQKNLQEKIQIQEIRVQEIEDQLKEIRNLIREKNDFLKIEDEVMRTKMIEEEIGKIEFEEAELLKHLQQEVDVLKSVDTNVVTSAVTWGETGLTPQDLAQGVSVDFWKTFDGVEQTPEALRFQSEKIASQKIYQSGRQAGLSETEMIKIQNALIGSRSPGAPNSPQGLRYQELFGEPYTLPLSSEGLVYTALKTTDRSKLIPRVTQTGKVKWSGGLYEKMLELEPALKTGKITFTQWVDEIFEKYPEDLLRQMQYLEENRKFYRSRFFQDLKEEVKSSQEWKKAIKVVPGQDKFVIVDGRIVKTPEDFLDSLYLWFKKQNQSSK